MRFILILMFSLLMSPAYAQEGPGALDENFRFIRIKYDSNSGEGGGGRWGRWRRRAWATDWPAADLNLHKAIERTTGIQLAGEPGVLTLKEKEIFDYPVLYVTEPGYWYIHEDEVENLRTYLERGGFLIVDDFHDYGRGQFGPQWDNFFMNIKQVFPDKEIVELKDDHPIWSIYYDIDPFTAVSTKGPYWAIDDDVYYGIYDDNGRLMVVICYNQDIGDGWEWPGRNLGEASTVSFQMAINFIMWALSH